MAQMDDTTRFKELGVASGHLRSLFLNFNFLYGVQPASDDLCFWILMFIKLNKLYMFTSWYNFILVRQCLDVVVSA